ncbi:MAG: acylphosphatase [Bacteroidales bacterium]|nr:acylphosphatase [Bacteroidales bacterium]MDG2081233.1 acylphosphatase [Bacteroidales bacterium]
MLKSNKIAAAISVYGKVQGVGFRFYANKKAKELNICGHVANKPNGTVYIEAEGAKSDLDSFIDWCSIGPQWAKVTRVEIQHVPPLNYLIFVIK